MTRTVHQIDSCRVYHERCATVAKTSGALTWFFLVCLPIFVGAGVYFGHLTFFDGGLTLLLIVVGSSATLVGLGFLVRCCASRRASAALGTTELLLAKKVEMLARARLELPMAQALSFLNTYDPGGDHRTLVELPPAAVEEMDAMRRDVDDVSALASGLLHLLAQRAGGWEGVKDALPPDLAAAVMRQRERLGEAGERIEGADARGGIQSSSPVVSGITDFLVRSLVATPLPQSNATADAAQSTPAGPLNAPPSTTPSGAPSPELAHSDAAASAALTASNPSPSTTAAEEGLRRRRTTGEQR